MNTVVHNTTVEHKPAWPQPVVIAAIAAVTIVLVAAASKGIAVVNADTELRVQAMERYQACINRGFAKDDCEPLLRVNESEER